MPRPNLLRIDDLLLRAAGMLALLWALGSAIWLVGWLQSPAQDGSLDLRGTGWMVAVAATAPVGALVAGLRVRRREKRAWALHRLIDDHVELPAADLLRDSDFDAQTLDRAIRDLNNAGAAFVVWDRENGLVQDGRLRAARVHIERCESCNAHVSVKVPLSEVAALRCPYCKGPMAAERLVEERARLIEELDADPAPARKDMDFSIPVFLLLTFLFWPLGVGYALWKWHGAHTG